MITFLDGPAAGTKLSLHRAPIFLRVVIDRETGRVDALDQLNDVPKKSEAVHVYYCPEPFMFRRDIIVCPPQAMASGEYTHRADVDGEQFRETHVWRAWCRAQPLDRETVDPIDGRTLPAEVAR